MIITYFPKVHQVTTRILYTVLNSELKKSFDALLVHIRYFNGSHYILLRRYNSVEEIIRYLPKATDVCSCPEKIYTQKLKLIPRILTFRFRTYITREELKFRLTI